MLKLVAVTTTVLRYSTQSFSYLRKSRSCSTCVKFFVALPRFLDRRPSASSSPYSSITLACQQKDKLHFCLSTLFPTFCSLMGTYPKGWSQQKCLQFSLFQHSLFMQSITDQPTISQILIQSIDLPLIPSPLILPSIFQKCSQRHSENLPQARDTHGQLGECWPACTLGQTAKSESQLLQMCLFESSFPSQFVKNS